MSLYLPSLPSVIAATGTAAATGLGISSTVFASGSSTTSGILEDQTSHLQSTIDDLEKKFKDFPARLREIMDAVKSSSPDVQSLNGKLDTVSKNHEDVNKKSTNIKSEVEKFSDLLKNVSQKSSNLMSLIKGISERVSYIETQSSDNLKYSNLAMKSAEGAEDLVEKTNSWIKQLIEKFEEKISQSINKKKQELKVEVEQKVKELKERASKEKEELKTSINSTKEELEKTRSYVQETLKTIDKTFEGL